MPFFVGKFVKLKVQVEVQLEVQVQVNVCCTSGEYTVYFFFFDILFVRLFVLFCTLLCININLIHASISILTP